MYNIYCKISCLFDILRDFFLIKKLYSEQKNKNLSTADELKSYLSTYLKIAESCFIDLIETEKQVFLAICELQYNKIGKTIENFVNDCSTYKNQFNSNANIFIKIASLLEFCSDLFKTKKEFSLLNPDQEPEKYKVCSNYYYYCIEKTETVYNCIIQNNKVEFEAIIDLSDLELKEMEFSLRLSDTVSKINVISKLQKAFAEYKKLKRA